MIRYRYFSVLASTLAIFATTATAGTVVETFDAGSNQYSWTWGFGDSLPTTEGNPNGYLRTEGLDTYAPQPQPLAAGSPFIGNYRLAGVTCIGVDLATFAVDFGAGGRPLTLMLIHDNGTPGEFSDDTAAYFMHAQNVPIPGEGWLSYEFSVLSDQTSLPAGWVLLNLGDSGSPAIHTWDQVIQSVSRMQFFYGNPEFFFIFQQWTLGMDNARVCIESKPPCPTDLSGDGSTGVPDLLMVINEWGPCAGCPEDLSGDDTVGVPDLLMVINEWGPCSP